jgi:hypothetical protein
MVHLAGNVGIVGTSPMESQILVSNQACAPNTGTFLMTEQAVLKLDPPGAFTSSSSPAPIKGFGINFYQPDSSDRNAMIQYPVAIRADARAYTRLSDIWITRAWNGISLLNNPGGSSFDEIYMAAYNVGFDIDNAQDSMRFNHIECAWNNLMSTNQMTALASLSTICIRSGRADDLHITDSTFLLDTGVHLYQSANGVTNGNITGTDFDSGAQLKVSAGVIGLSNCTITNGGNWTSVAITGGDVRMDGCWIFDGVSSATPTISVSNTLGSLILSDSTVTRSSITGGDNFADRTLLVASGAGNVRIDNVFFRGNTSNTATPTRPIISFTNHTRGSVSHSFMYGSPAIVPGTFLQVTDDEWLSVIGNQFMNWKMILPTNATCAGLPSCYISARLNTGLAAGSSAQRDTQF